MYIRQGLHWRLAQGHSLSPVPRSCGGWYWRAPFETYQRFEQVIFEEEAFEAEGLTSTKARREEERQKYLIVTPLSHRFQRVAVTQQGCHQAGQQVRQVI